MYKFKEPLLHEIVFVQLSRTTKDENYVKLVDYDNIEGLILCTEINKYNSNIKKVVKSDEIFPVIIISTERGYDLSYSKIKNDYRILLKECYEYQKKIYNLLIKIFELLNLDNNLRIKLLQNNINPSIYDESINSKKNLSKELYESILINSDVLYENIELYDDEIKQRFNIEVQKHLIKKPYIIQKDFKLLIFDEKSLETLKLILFNIQNIQNIQNIDIKYNFIVECKSSPIYYYQISHTNIDEIVAYIKNIDNKLRNIAENFNCKITIKNDYNIIKSGEIIFV